VYKIGIEAYTHSMETYMLKIQQLILLQVYFMTISYGCNLCEAVAVALPSLKLIFKNLFYESKEYHRIEAFSKSRAVNTTT
jgi:hypothetical protein